VHASTTPFGVVERIDTKKTFFIVVVDMHRPESTTQKASYLFIISPNAAAGTDCYTKFGEMAGGYTSYSPLPLS